MIEKIERKKLGGSLAELWMVLFLAVSPAWAQSVETVTHNRVKTLLEAGKPTLGVVMTIPSPLAAETLAGRGFDWTWSIPQSIWKRRIG